MFLVVYFHKVYFAKMNNEMETLMRVRLFFGLFLLLTILVGCRNFAESDAFSNVMRFKRLFSWNVPKMKRIMKDVPRRA